MQLIRLIANLAIHEEIGVQLAAADGIQILCHLLGTACSNLYYSLTFFSEKKDIVTSEELVLNIVGAITNLSFYHSQDNIILKNQIKISKRMLDVLHSPQINCFVVLIPLLLFKNEEAIVESVRAYGNFSRDSKVRRLMVEKRRTSRTKWGGGGGKSFANEI